MVKLWGCLRNKNTVWGEGVLCLIFLVNLCSGSLWSPAITAPLFGKSLASCPSWWWRLHSWSDLSVSPVSRGPGKEQLFGPLSWILTHVLLVLSADLLHTGRSLSMRRISLYLEEKKNWQRTNADSFTGTCCVPDTVSQSKFVRFIGFFYQPREREALLFIFIGEAVEAQRG
jgi:hypothetical protein